jgi:hypothetical protein
MAINLPNDAAARQHPFQEGSLALRSVGEHQRVSEPAAGSGMIAALRLYLSQAPSCRDGAAFLSQFRHKNHLSVTVLIMDDRRPIFI